MTREVIPGSEVLGVAVSLVGTVDGAHKRWVSTARWRNIQNLDFGILERSLDQPVLINRMQDAELLYFLQKNPPYREKNVLFVHWGFGIGASYASKGKLLESTLGRTCEIGHMRVTSYSDKQCQCGAYGCLETEAALWALQGNTHLENELPFLAPGVIDEEELGRQFQEIDVSGNPLIENALNHFCLALYNLHQVFYPDTVLFLGPVTENPWVFQQIKRYIERELPAYARDRVEFLVLSGGFKGCIRSSVYPFFQGRLESLLRVRSF